MAQRGAKTSSRAAAVQADSVLSGLTIAQCLVMIRRIFRRYHGLRP